MDYWQVHDADNPFCAYGAQAYELTIWVGASGWGNQVWYVYEAPGECCPFESRAPEHQIPHSSIYWDGTINTGFGNCYGCPVTTGTTYFYELNMFGCGGQKTYVGSIYVSGDVNGMVLQEPGVVTVDDSLQVRFIQDVATEPLDENQAAVLYVFPNPATEHVWVQYANGLEQVSILDATGRRVLEINTRGSSDATLSLQGLSPASYFLVVMDKQGRVHNRKLIKQ